MGWEADLPQPPSTLALPSTGCGGEAGFMDGIEVSPNRQHLYLTLL